MSDSGESNLPRTDLEVIIADPTYDHPERNRDAFLDDLRGSLDELKAAYELHDSDIGPAADLPAILVVITGLLFLAKPINDNIEAWIKLGRKFQSVLQTIGARLAEPRLDENGATLLALCEIANNLGPELRSIEIVSRQTVPFWVFPLRDPRRLDHHPDSLYIQAFRVNDTQLFVFGIKSRGAIEFRHQYEASYLNF